jgi:DNA-binding PadR family transcriptional regulator
VTRWLQSGTRRDLCVLLYGAGELRAQQLKSRLESHYEGRVEPRQYYGALDRLVSTGHVETRTEGIHDVYSLTDAGERALREHYAWFTDRVEKEDGKS